MQLTILFLLFSSFFFLNSSQNPKIHDELPSYDRKLLKAVCKIVKDVTSSRTDTQDILIGHIGGGYKSQAVNEVIQCIDSDQAVVVTRFYAAFMNKTLRKASVIVLFDYQPERNLIRHLISKEQFSTVWHHMAKIICVVPSFTPRAHRSTILSTFASLGFYNVVTIRVDDDGEILVDSFYHPISKLTLNINLNDIADVFPDKLKNMSGFRYKIPVIQQPPQVNIIGIDVRSPMMHFLELVCKKQKAGIEINILPDGYHLINAWKARQMDLSINTAAVFDNTEQNLNNYNKKSFCALIPIPQKTLTFRLTIILPFDYLIWVLLVLSIAASVAVWWLYHGRGAVDSHWLLLAEIYKMFFGQGFTLSRNNHFMLLTLMQLICLLIFVIGNAYESEITSCMIEPIHDNRLRTVADLLASKYEIATDEGFAYMLEDNTGFKELKSKVKVTDLNIDERFVEEVNNRHYALISMCDTFEYYMRMVLNNGRYLYEDYYILPEAILWEYVRLEASYLNPFLERFQLLMDLSFQAGLPHMWKVIETIDMSSYSKVDSSEVAESLRYEDLHEVFRVLIIGLAMSAAVFLLEIFYHDCIGRVDGRVVVQFLRSKFRSLTDKCRTSRSRARRIRVQSRN